MEGVSTTEVPAPDELARIIDGIIQQRLLIALSEDEAHFKLQQQKLAFESEKRRKRWQTIRRWTNLINSWTWAVLLMAIIFSLGIYLGVNLIPKGVICSSRESLCYFLRFDGNKRLLERSSK
ncbi:hypothetical protein [Chroococcus sp. FPU101]|uniref:hypothetical protein n=1 Tax=Chroococcus sp. FPU101 TaxID=1974212 RepID=UPI001A8ECAF5|nr:hypothetical protein [Chroococcus sp. FPU101]